MLKQSLYFALFLALACSSASGGESGGRNDPMKPYDQADAGAEPSPGYRVSGTVISPSGRVAIFNGIPSQEGDWVDGAQIISIGAKAVRMRTKLQEFTVHLGSSGARDSVPDPSIRVSRKSTTPHLHAEQTVLAGPVRPEDQAIQPRFDTHKHYGPVQWGETLSDIAQRHAGDGISTNKMMIALFRVNPQAFGRNIDILREGAVLRIPDWYELHDQPPAPAMVEVASKQSGQRSLRETRLIKEPGYASHGPVNRGETLSGIAQRYKSDSITIHQMTIALFQANPHAFNGNINRLREGVVLRIPNGDELHYQSSDLAAAEVVRQTEAWRARPRRQARLEEETGIMPALFAENKFGTNF